jgi:RHS repeat-associated protein
MPPNATDRPEEGRDEKRVPSITLPKGGGALRSIDEKFTVNAVNGSCELSVPLPFSKTRGGLDSSIALQYSSGSGNSVFGLGWSLTLPSIRRRTDKRLPRYEDEHESDVFLYSGAEDLVPAFVDDGAGNWTADVVDAGGVHVERYRPRIEGLFARIEKISVAGESASYWKVTTRDNVATIFGRTAAARIADPSDSSRVFAWLPEWSWDDKGNCFELTYLDEDLQNTPDAVDEKNRRAGLAAFSNKHLKSVRYGNKVPYFPAVANPLDPPPPAAPAYFFQAVLDYGDHDDLAPMPAPSRPWSCRFDPFSDCRVGFEMRTYRLCRRILFFHFFPQLGPAPQLVRSLDLQYRHFLFDGAPYRSEETDLLTAMRTVLYRGAARKAMPAVELSYQEPGWNTAVSSLAVDDLEGLPAGVPPGYQWLDLFGNGAPGILTEESEAWYFKGNLGEGRFGAPRAIAPKPSLAGVASGALQFQDLDADGSKQLVSLQTEPRGYFQLDDDNDWQPFRPFERNASETGDPNARFIDVDGDGKPDLVVSEDVVFRWYPSLGTRGFDAPRLAPKAFDEESGPAVVFADETQSIFIADMNGDGLADIVRVRRGDVSYWPNLGYARFGAKVTMRNAPQFDSLEDFDPRRVQLADISGTGAADLIYLGEGRFRAWTNLAGNAWSDARVIDPFPGTEPPNRVSVLDLLGNGTVSLVWSSELPASASSPIRYVDLMGGRKPYVLTSIRNRFGKEVLIEYRSSAHYALHDQRDGTPWATKLPFPSMCVSRTETRDLVSGSRFAQEYRYRHGYYDHEEREFRGFGMIEQIDTETFEHFSISGAANVVDTSLHQAPVRTRSWYHTGAFLRGERLATRFAAEYFSSPHEELLADAFIDPLPSTPEEMRQAARACKGMLLRQEVYADDGSADAGNPYSTTTRNCAVRMLQPAFGDRYAVFLAAPSETITRGYERDPADPRIAHQIDTVIDEMGNVVETASIAYGRTVADLSLPVEVQQEQVRLLATYCVHQYTNDVITDSARRLRQRCETRVYELTGIAPAGTCFTRGEIRALFAGAVIRPFEAPPTAGLVQKRLMQAERTLFASNADPNAALPFRALQGLAIPYEQYKLALTPSLRTALYGGRLDDAMLGEGAYLRSNDAKALGLFPVTDAADEWWAPSGTTRYSVNPQQHFYMPQAYVDPFGSATTVRYFSDHHLLIDRTEDALGSVTTVLAFDFRLLQPQSVVDINDNITDVAFDVTGLVVGTALRGKGAEVDDLAGFVSDPPQADVDAFFSDPAANGPALLQHATTRFLYRLDAVPVVAATIERETHHQAALAAGVPSRLRYAFEYSDGLGRVAMKKAQAEPGLAKLCVVHPDDTCTITDVDTSPNLRWIGSGRPVFNNKGKRVMQYEPYFSVTHAYETSKELVESGVTALTFHDPLGRVVRTESPDATFSRVEIGGWVQRAFDNNDTVLGSDWYTARIGGALGSFEQSAAQKTTLHAGTPATTHFDSLGRAIATVAQNRFVDRITLAVRNESYLTRVVLEINGKRRAVHDERDNVVMQYFYDLLGRPAHTISMDGGDRRLFPDATEKELYGWDAAGNRFHTLYDALRRPTENIVLTAAAVTFVSEKSVYGADKTKNQNGKLIQQFDDSGVVEHTRYDFKGNSLESSRRFTDASTGGFDWSNPALIALRAAQVTRTAYDALNRVVSTATADGSVITQTYSESSLVSAIAASIRGAAPRPFIVRITHDAKGQRQEIAYGNGVTTALTYDPKTFRVRRIRSVRASDSAVLQDLQYTYDPVGNVTTVRDVAQQTIYFNNQIVEPHNDYVHDAVYRLVEARGREHIGLNEPVSRFDAVRTALVHRADGNAMQRYRQQYDYDAAGNLLAMVHSAGSGPFIHQWTRQFTPAASNNHLLTSTVGAATDTFTYDAHGNLAGMTGFAPLQWDEHDRFRGADLGGGGTARYTYSGGNQRARKVVERSGGIVEERLYLGLVEFFTRTHNAAVELQRETLHVMDGAQRLVMVDTRTAGAGPGPAQLVRYQFSNHLGSATLELDDAGGVISYEEYYPFGNTSFQSVDASREVPARRYRYTGKERDEESGFYYHGARYYAPWLARWISRDPAGIVDGTNVYAYSRNRPVTLSDPSGTQTETPNNPPTFTVGPFGFRNVHIAPRFELSLQGHDLLSSNRSVSLAPGTHHLGGTFRSDVQVDDISFLSGTASATADVGLTYLPSIGILGINAQGRGQLTAGPFEARLDATILGSTLFPERVYLNTWEQQLSQTVRDIHAEAWANVSVGISGRPLAYVSLHAEAREGGGTFEGRGLLGLPPLDVGGAALPIASVRTHGTFSYDIDRFQLRGAFSVLSPVALGGGSYSYDSSRGLGVNAGYFGLLIGPTGLGVDINPLEGTTSTDPRFPSAPRPGGQGFGTIDVFDPGFAIGGSYISYTRSRTLVISAGFAPTPTIEHYSPDTPRPTGALGSFPGVTPALEFLYNRPLSTPAGVYGGASLKVWF